MASSIKFTLEGSGTAIDFSPARVIIAGYTGRNQEETRAHIRELERQGIPTPAEIPAIFRTTLDRLTTDGEIEVVGDRTAGETEAVLLVKGGDLWIAVGSDHTDRKLETFDIPASKQVCPKPISAQVWRYADVRERWDKLVLRSWVGDSGRETPYQQGRMAALLRPEDLLEVLKRRLGDAIDNAAIYTGTIPLIGGKFANKPFFTAELYDEETGRSLVCAYRVRAVEIPQ
jgi:Protein of unknown function (DUF2848)